MKYCTIGLHSDCSISRSAIKLSELEKLCKKFDTVSITDNGNTSALIRAIKANKKTIPAVELNVVHQYTNSISRDKIRLYAFDLEGYKTLCNMINLANKNKFRMPRISIDELRLDGNIKAIVDEDFPFIDKLPKDKTYISVNKYSNLLNPIYVQYKCIFYYDVYSINQEDTQTISVLSVDGFNHDKDVHLYDDDQISKAYLVPGAIDNYDNFCNEFKPFLEFKDRYPVYCQNSEIFFDGLVWAGFHRKYPEATKQHYERLEYEISVIKKMGFMDYFLITWDFIDWSRRENIPIGPGRGSAAGSVVSYCLDITKLDPISNGLYFERFLNPDRISPPDIDTDINTDDRQRVIDYINQKYGSENISQIVTFGVLKSRSAFKDACRLAKVPADVSNEITKKFPPNKFGTPPTLEEVYASDTIKDWINSDQSHKEAWSYANKLEGFIRQTGVHAAGLIISPEKISDITGISYVDGVAVCQWDKNDSEKFGLLKMDFLGLATLGLIKNTCNKLGKSYYDMEQIPLDDPKVYAEFRKGNTHGIFQFESNGMKQLLIKISPTSFADISAATALYRPGPLMAGLADEFVKNKHAENRKYFMPDFETLLGETYGVMVYQEQVMKIAQEIAGFSLPKADTLRKAIGKKDKKMMEQLKDEFINGAANLGHSEKKIAELWDQIVGFADYCFNKSHSYAYALISYWSMYLKVYHPLEFTVSLLSDDMKNTDKMQTHFFELQGRIKFYKPTLNEAKENFSISTDGIRIGYGCIKGIGNEGKNIDANQPYKNLVDTVVRNDLDKTRITNMIYAGCFDTFEKDKSVLLGNYQALLKHGKNNNKSSDFFNLFDPCDTFNLNMNSRKVPPSNDKMEVEAYGYNIFHGYLIENSWILKKLKSDQVAGKIFEIKYITTKTGKSMAIITLDTVTERKKIPVFPEHFDKFGHFLFTGHTYIFKGSKYTRTNFDGEEEENFVPNEMVNVNEAHIASVEIECDSAYDEKWFVKNLEPRLVGEGSVQLSVYHLTHEGWTEAFKYPRKVNYNSDIQDYLSVNGMNISVSYFS